LPANIGIRFSALSSVSPKMLAVGTRGKNLEYRWIAGR